MSDSNPIQITAPVVAPFGLSELGATYHYEGFEGEIARIRLLYMGRLMLYARLPRECWETRGAQAMELFLKKGKREYLHPGDFAIRVSPVTLRVLAQVIWFCRGVKKILFMQIA